MFWRRTLDKILKSDKFREMLVEVVTTGLL